MKTTVFIVLLSLISGIARADYSTERNYTEVGAYLRKLVSEHSQKVEIFTLGVSDSGVAIEGVKIGHGPVRNLVVAAHHGNEYGAPEVALNFAESVAQRPIEGQTIYVIPVLNIQGYNSRSRWERVNGRSVDPNRDYPGPCGTEGPFHLKSTRALADFIDREQIVASATLHTYWPAAIYPWGLSSHDLETPYTPIFMKMVQTATEQSSYQVGNSAEVIYPADGTFEDYAFWKHGIWSILFELGNSHYPGIQAIETMVKDNTAGLRRMFETAPKSRAENHEFSGKCSVALRALDMHIE